MLLFDYFGFWTLLFLLHFSTSLRASVFQERLPGVSHDVSERPALEELHDDPQLVAHQVAVVHVDHVLVMVVPHDHHLKHTHTHTHR